ncbi:MAG: hypothetical protein M1831_005690 [Alyxoria varia]|nr:MAG: hypothetical protein M1831_005690 [Alyxoria varia]
MLLPRICVYAAFLLHLPTTSASANPVITQAPELPTRTHKRRSHDLPPRDIVDDAKSKYSSAKGRLNSKISSIGQNGEPDWFFDLPTGTKAASSAGVTDIEATPTSVLNFPPYANWTDEGAWNVRFHGNIYRQPRLSRERLDDLTNGFLIGPDVEDLPESQQKQARNVTAQIFIVQEDDAGPPVFSLAPAPTLGTSSGGRGGGGGTTPSEDAGAQTVRHNFDVTAQGDYDEFVPIRTNGLQRGDRTDLIQRLNVYTNGTDTGNATAYLVPPEGITVVSDIDDILRITQIWSPKQIILNTFARPYTAWLNMPEIFRGWSRSLQLNGAQPHFHYLTTLPEQVTRNYEEFIFNNFPGGSFDTRPLNFSDVSATLAIRRYLLERVLDTFPKRKFVLLADVSNSDVMKAYPQLAKERPNQVMCVLLRNTTTTDDTFNFPYNTGDFEDLPQRKYMFFNTPDDLTGLDIASGQCYNDSIRQNVTFSYQNLPFGLGEDGDEEGAGSSLREGLSRWWFGVGLAVWGLWALL